MRKKKSARIAGRICTPAGNDSAKLFGVTTKPTCVDASIESHVERDESASQDLRERDVLGVVGFGPAELVGELPRGHRQSFRSALVDVDVAGQEALQRAVGERPRYFFSEGELVQCGWHLAPQQGWSEELFLAQCVGRAGADPVERELDDDARVEDQHVQWFSRERLTAATMLGIGSPVSVSPQPAGSGAISVGSSMLAVRTAPLTLAPGPFPKSLCRRSLSFIPRILAPGGRLLDLRARDGLVMSRIEFMGARLRTDSDGRRDRDAMRPQNPSISGLRGRKPGAKTLTAPASAAPTVPAPASTRDPQQRQGCLHGITTTRSKAAPTVPGCINPRSIPTTFVFAEVRGFEMGEGQMQKTKFARIAERVCAPANDDSAKLVVLGRPTAAKTFTRFYNLRSRHATAGKQERVGDHLAQLRSSSLSGADRRSHATVGKQERVGNHPALLRSSDKADPTLTDAPHINRGAHVPSILQEETQPCSNEYVSI
jgi:hypothetical protein